MIYLPDILGYFLTVVDLVHLQYVYLSEGLDALPHCSMCLCIISLMHCIAAIETTSKKAMQS